MSAGTLRQKAAQCRRLGRGQDTRTLLVLTSMSDEYEAEADRYRATCTKALLRSHGNVLDRLASRGPRPSQQS